MLSLKGENQNHKFNQISEHFYKERKASICISESNIPKLKNYLLHTRDNHQDSTMP